MAAAPTAPVTDPTTTNDAYPNGHLGHLTANEAKALEEFKRLTTARGSYSPGPPASHDDPTLIRYLRARRWNIEDAWKQFKETEDWRRANDVDTIYQTIDVAAFGQSRLMYPQWTGRRDRRGVPLYVFEIRNLDSKTVSTYEKTLDKPYSQAKPDGSTPTRLLRLVALYESLTHFVNPLCTNLRDREFPDVPITQSTNITDVQGVSLRMFWNLKAHMQLASTLATAHYPETLDRIFIINAPYFFSTVWGWISRWFDPVTVSKIFILGSDEVFPTLSKFIDPKNIPTKYGGELEYRTGMMPVLDPATAQAVTWSPGHTDFPNGPWIWKVADDGKTMECNAIGSVDGRLRHERICTMPIVAGSAAEQSLPSQDMPASLISGDTTDAASPAEAQEPMP